MIPHSADVANSVVLARFIQYWGAPKLTSTMIKGEAQVAAYTFEDGQFARFATVGVSGVLHGMRRTGFELVVILPLDLGGATADEVMHLMFDVSTYGMRSDVVLAYGYVIPPSPLVPRAWRPRALLIDEAVGEPTELSTIHVGEQHIDVFWLVPIHEAEYEHIRDHGPEHFYELADASEASLVDPTRRSFVF